MLNGTTGAAAGTGCFAFHNDKEGKRNGLTALWYKSGCKKAEQNWEDGVLVNEVVFADKALEN